MAAALIGVLFGIATGLSLLASYLFVHHDDPDHCISASSLALVALAWAVFLHFVVKGV